MIDKIGQQDIRLSSDHRRIHDDCQGGVAVEFRLEKRMIEVGSREECRRKVEEDVERIWRTIATSVPRKRVASLDEAVSDLAVLRRQMYEDLNQIQHEYAILKAIDWCSQSGYSSSITWHWNPRATGTSEEPDLLGLLDDAIVLSAEVTTSHRPQGVIDRRMATTLFKLSRMGGQLFYFVTSSSMARRARTKIARQGYGITVVELTASPD